MAKKQKAISKYLTLQNKDEASRTWFNEGYFACRKAAYAAFATALTELPITKEQLIQTMRSVDDRLMFYSGEEELIQEAFDNAGLILDFDGVFANERITEKEA